MPPSTSFGFIPDHNVLHSSGYTSTPPAGTDIASMAAASTAALLDADAGLWAVVLAGGIGSRFWPLSGPRRPKPLLCLLSDAPLIRECVDRLHPLIPIERVLVVTSDDIADGIRAALPLLPAWNVLVEPRPLGTAAALALAAHEIARRSGPEALMAIVHPDVAVSFPDLFRQSLRVAGGAASRHDVVVLLGTTATRPEPQFGYLVPQTNVEGDTVPVTRFIEKPSLAEAEALTAAGALWHTGVGVTRARVVQQALRRHVPEVTNALHHLDAGDLASWFAAVRPISIERGLFERAGEVLHVLRTDFGFDDVGTWASLRRSRDLDDAGNGGFGRTHFVEASGNIVHAEGAEVVLFGVDQLLVVCVDGFTLVTTLDRAADLRPLMERRPEAGQGRDGAPAD